MTSAPLSEDPLMVLPGRLTHAEPFQYSRATEEAPLSIMLNSPYPLVDPCTTAGTLKSMSVTPGGVLVPLQMVWRSGTSRLVAGKFGSASLQADMEAGRSHSGVAKSPYSTWMLVALANWVPDLYRPALREPRRSARAHDLEEHVPGVDPVEDEGVSPRPRPGEGELRPWEPAALLHRGSDEP